jgi:hypothetical protein
MPLDHQTKLNTLLLVVAVAVAWTWAVVAAEDKRSTEKLQSA